MRTSPSVVRVHHVFADRAGVQQCTSRSPRADGCGAFIWLAPRVHGPRGGSPHTLGIALAVRGPCCRAIAARSWSQHVVVRADGGCRSPYSTNGLRRKQKSYRTAAALSNFAHTAIGCVACLPPRAGAELRVGVAPSSYVARRRQRPGGSCALGTVPLRHQDGRERTRRGPRQRTWPRKTSALRRSAYQKQLPEHSGNPSYQQLESLLSPAARPMTPRSINPFYT